MSHFNKQINTSDIILKLTLDIKRAESDRYPGYAQYMATVNDVMRELTGEKLTIEYNGNDAKVAK